MTADSQTKAAKPNYLTDVAYLRTFSNNLAPPLLRAVAALNGFTPPPADDFDYCELGSGHGDTTATLAAAHPRARFLGVDVMPEHVAFASGLAHRGGLENVRFLERDFEDLGREDLPSFDFIAAHGVMSWISPEKRQALLAFAEARLKPGGLLYVSYNALPGWAAVEPLRRLMVLGPGSADLDTLERARRGLALAKLMNDAQAGYFTSNPAAKLMLETMASSGLNYVVHEYFTPHWHPMYFADVAREMASRSLYFVGQLPLHLNYGDLVLPAALGQLFKSVTDRLVFESLKDYALNEFFRREVYIKGMATRSEAATQTYLDTTPFGTALAASRLPREVRLSHYTLKFDAPLFDVLLPALAERASSLQELAQRPELAAFGEKRLRESVLHLLLGELALPMQCSTPPSASPAGGQYRTPSSYNRMILGQELSRDSTLVLASPVAGAGVVVSGLEAASIHLLTEVERTRRPAWIRAWAARASLPSAEGERAPHDAAANAQALEDALAELRAHRLSKLVQLGVLERVG